MLDRFEVIPLRRPDDPPSAAVNPWPRTEGELASLIRGFPWERTPLGGISGWPPTLRIVVDLMLRSPVPMVLLWGPDGIMIYNDAYSGFAGGRHPRLLGAKVLEGWSEVADFNRHVLETGLSGRTLSFQDQHLVLYRHGRPEEVWLDLDYSPVPGEDGRPGGVLAIVGETTGRVVGARRIAALRELEGACAGARSAEEACARAAEVLRRFAHDVAFSCLYLVGPDGVPRPTPAGSPGEDAAWPFHEARARAVVVDRLQARGLPGGSAPEPAERAMVLPLSGSASERPAGFLVLGVNPRRPFDDPYKGFLELVAAGLARAVSSARSYEEERRRAEALSELDRAKTVFFSNVSHELRTPLTLLLGPVENALAGPAGRMEKADLELVYRGALRLQKLVNTLLSFARLEAGRLQASFRPLDLSRFTAEIASAFQSAVERAGLSYEVDAPPLPEPVYVDPDLWERIVLNLVSNALKHTFAGAIRVTLGSAGDRIRLQVSDTGVGIPESELPRLFERFHRVQGARSRSHEGSGIGLALVHELVRLHGGTVGVESRLGRGSTFTIEIPRGRAHLPSAQVREDEGPAVLKDAASFVEEARSWLGGAASPALAPSLKDAPALPSRTGRILLADDNADMREYLRRLLEPHWTVEAVANGREALEAVARRRPDLVLSDVMMPELDGLGLLRALREDPRTRTVPVILLSARAGEESAAAGLAEGADDYVVKPFTRQELLARVDAHLRLSRLRSESQRAIRDSEATLRARSEELLAVMETVPAIVWVARDPEGTSITGNRMSYELLRLDPRRNASLSADGDGAPTHFRVFHHGVELSPDDLPIQRALREKQPIRGFEERILFDDGTLVDLIGNVELLHGEGNEIRGAVAAFVDITKLKAVESQIRDLNLGLERRVEERTRSLRDALRELETFSYTVAHDLRAPLRAVSGFANLLREDHIPPGDLAGQSFAGRLVAAAERMDALVLDLLDYSRLARQDLPLSRQDPRTALDDVLQGLDPELARRGARVAVDGPMHAVLANPVALRQALANLIDNATKFVPVGRPPSVLIRSEVRGSRVRLWVEDNGIGIAPEYQSQVFGVFQRLHRTEDYPGTGIGLAIVKKAVEKMGGDVGLESRIGEGSRFYIELAGIT